MTTAESIGYHVSAIGYTHLPPPPPGSSSRALLVWALAEAATWPLCTPQWYYTYWLRAIERERGRAVVKQTRMEF